MGHRVIRLALAVASLCALGCSWEWDRYLPTGADAGTDVGAMDAPDAQAGCASDDECARASADRPVCDARTGRCVACTAERDACGEGRYCAADDTCATGCNSDAACAAATPDGGVADGGVAAGRCDPATHACVQCLADEHCPVGTRCVDRACRTGCDASRACPAGRTCCGGACVDPATDASHCGACGALCSALNGVPACAAGRCGVGRCNDPFADCDGDPSTGCESNTRTAAAHCGGCGMACATRANASAACVEGACRYECERGYGDCDGDPANGCEVDLSRTLSHCGRCGEACSFAGAVGACVGGVCTRTACAAGRGDCDGIAANGCEVDLQSDAAHCRVCRTACAFPRATGVCASGVCALGRCEAGRGNCDNDATNGCETDLATSPAHCGVCGLSCAFPRAGATCAAGVCAIGACAAGAGNCDGALANGCETSLDSSVAHCGRCGGACPARPNATATCAAATCGFACAAGFGNCDGNAANGCETSTLATVTACGACGAACSLPNAVPACRAGVCAVGSCRANFADCDGNPANGCEVDIRTSADHCGACRRACSPANSVGACAAGACTVASCSSGYENCDRLAANGCEAHVITSSAHCGGCGNACPAGQSCQVGRCALPVFGGYDVTPSPAGVSWLDVCAEPGAVQVLVGEDDRLTTGPLPFPVAFWGTTNRSYVVSSNGWVGFGRYYFYVDEVPAETPYRHFGELPREGTPRPAAFVLGVDLVQGPRGICIATVGAVPNRRFVVQATGATLYLSTRTSGPNPLPPSAFSYELIAYEGSGHFDMVYDAPFSGPGGAPIIAPTNVTVGLQDYRTPLRAAVFNGPITATTRIRYTPR